MNVRQAEDALNILSASTKLYGTFASATLTDIAAPYPPIYYIQPFSQGLPPELPHPRLQLPEQHGGFRHTLSTTL